MTDPSDIPRIKGAAFREFVLWYDRTHDGERLRRALARVPEAEREGLRPDAPALGVLASNWYSVALAGVLLDAVCEDRTADEQAAVARDGSRAVVDTMLTGVYRFLFERVSSPDRYARHIGRLWRQLHSTGDRKIHVTGPGEADSVIESWPGHHPLLCLVTMETMAAVYEAMRCREVTVARTACVSAGDPLCRARLRWTGPG